MVARVDRNTVSAVRRFSRFYTRVIGALEEQHLDSPYSLAEVRLMFEITHRDAPTAAALVRDLGLDAGYLSRLVGRMIRRRLVKRTASATDGREHHLALTAQGRKAFAEVDSRTNEHVAALIANVPAREHARLLGAMRGIETLLGSTMADEHAPGITLRSHRAGDMGWVIRENALFYAREYGWDTRYEALVARIAADFIDNFDASREHCWIAERDGVNVGCVFLVKHPDHPGVARLRILLVHDTARGLGLGARLVAECTRFARQCAYHTITLWTNDVLISARRIYQAEGYRLVHEEKHHSFGKDLVGQTWELDLGQG